MDNNFGNLYYDYIGATGTHSISDYIDISSNNNYSYTCNSSNINSNYTFNSSNINSNYTFNSSNINKNYTDTNIINLDNKYNKLIREIPDNSLTNLYINNSNIGGEIRFFVKQSGIFDINNASGQLYRVKIGNDGKLYLYYNYNVAIGLLETERWVEPINMIIGHNVALGNLNAITGATDIAVGNLLFDVNTLKSLVGQNVISSFSDSLILRDTSSTYGLLKIAYENIKQQFTYANAVYAGIVGSVGFGLVFMAYGFIQSKVNADYIENNLKYQLSSNNVMTPEEKEQLKIDTFNVYTSNINDMNYYSCNLNILQGFTNSNIITQQLIPNLKTSLLNLNGGNITNVSNITTLGKIKENNIFLESTYATINYVNTNLFNNSYSQERLYPPKTFNSYTLATASTEILGRDCFKETITLTSDNITYGSGIYNIYSSSSYGDFNFSVFNIFNFTTNTAGFWGSGNYNYNTGFFNRTDTFLKNNYFGDWVVIKLLSPLILNRFKLYYTNPYSAPALWRLYGSSDGLIFTEINEGGNFIDALNINNYSEGFYEKIFDNTKEYLYIGIVINKIIGGNISASYLNFGQFQLYGVNVNNYNNVYATSNAVKYIVRNEMSDIPKRKMFLVSIPSSATFFDGTTNTTYYKWDLDLRLYTTTQIIPSIPITNDLLRCFKISFWYVPSYFGSFLNGEPYVVSYSIFMSNKSNPVFNRPETAGVNIYAIGFPENIRLENILPNNLMLLKNFNSNFNYLTIISRQPADLYCIIEDQLF
jgi:hypothetical protein